MRATILPKAIIRTKANAAEVLNQSSDFNFVFAVNFKKSFLFHTKFMDFG